MGLFDVHAHLTHPRLAADEDAVLANAKAAGVTSILVNGLNPADNEAVAALAARSDLVRPCFGLYPVDAVLPEMIAAGVDYPRDEGPVWEAEDAVAWVADHVDEAFAVGEIGLDGYWVPEDLWDRQEEVFRKLLRIAKQADKAVIIHTRKRERRTLEVLQEEGIERVDWHCFGSKVKLARQIAEHGHYLSIPANVRRVESFRRMVETLPKDRILLETDCPYLGPERGMRSEPAHVAGTAGFMAEVWGWTEAEVWEQLAGNYERLFGVGP